MSPGAALKRALITLLLALARQYELVLNINRDSPDQQVKSAFRKVILRAHPDKRGGSEAAAKKLNAAYTSWQESGRARGRPASDPGQPTGLAPVGGGLRPAPFARRADTARRTGRHMHACLHACTHPSMHPWTDRTYGRKERRKDGRPDKSKQLFSLVRAPCTCLLVLFLGGPTSRQAKQIVFFYITKAFSGCGSVCFALKLQ